MRRLFRDGALAPPRTTDVRDAQADDAARGATISVILETFGALTGALAISIVVTWPLVRELESQIFGLGGDSFGGMASFRLWADEIGYRVTGVSHVDSWGAPFGFDQANGVNVQSASAFFPAYVVTELANEVLAYNLVVLSGLTLSGAAMYWLCRRLGCGYVAAAWAGLVYIVFPWHLVKAQGHPSLTHLEGFPLLLLGLIGWHAAANVRRALVVAAVVALLWTTSGYFGLMALVALPVPLAVAAYLHARESGWRSAVKRAALPGAGALIVSGAVYALASSGSGSDAIAPPQPVGSLEIYGARWWEFVVPAAQNPRFGGDMDQWLGARLHGSNFSETSLYLGWLTIALALAFVAWALLRRSRVPAELRFATIMLSATVVTGVVFSLPSPVVGELPGPVQLIWEVAPQFRVPSRFVALAMAALVPLAALSLDRIPRVVSRRSPSWSARIAAAAVCGLAGLISFLELSISPPAQITDVSSMPHEYSALHRSPPGTLAEYPLASSEHGITSDYLFYRRAHGRRLLNGAPPGTFSDTLRQTLVDPVTPGTAEGLAALGVSAIVVRPNVYGFTGGPAAPPADLGRGYRRLATSPSGNTVWRVSAGPAPAIAGFGSGFYASETPTAGTTMRWMGSIGTVELFARRAGTYRAAFSAGAYGKPRVITIESAEGSRQLFVLPVQRPQSLVLRLPVGRSRLTLTATPEAEPIPDGRRASTYVSNWRLEPVRTTTGQRPLASSRFPS